MDLFTYLMAKNGHNTSIHEDLFSYLLGKSQGGGGEIKTATGITINIPDAKKLVSFMMTKESTQETTTGKNLLNPSVVEGTKNGITYSFDSETQTYTFNGTCTSDNTLITSICQNVIEFTKDITTLSVHYVSGSATGGRVDFLNSSYAGINLNIDNISSSTPILSKTTTFDYSSTVFNSRFRFDNGNTVNNLKIKLMVANTTDTSYEEYTGGIPSPNPDYPQEVKTVKGYRNLFDKDNANKLNVFIATNNDNLNTSSSSKSLYISCKANTNYTITKISSARFKVASSSVLPAVNVSITRYFFSNDAATIATITTDSNANYLIITYYNSNDDTLTEQEILNSIQIVEGTQELPYVSYGNNYIYTKVVGKNLFDKNAITNNYYYDTSGQYVSSTNVYITDFIQVKSNLNYIYSTISVSNRKRINFFDNNKNWVSQIYSDASDYTFTIPNNIKYIRISFNGNIDSNTIQIEEGTTATAYEAYKETTTTIPLNNNEIVGIGDYKDELKIDKSGHVFINKKTGKVVFDGSESGWNLHSNNVRRTAFQILKRDMMQYTNQSALPNVFSNYFRPMSEGDTWVSGIISSRTVGKYIDLCVEPNTTLEQFKTWLSTHNTEVYYVLAQENLIDLQTTVDLKLFKGVNNVSNSEDGYMTIQYMSENEEA